MLHIHLNSAAIRGSKVQWFVHKPGQTLLAKWERGLELNRHGQRRCRMYKELKIKTKRPKAQSRGSVLQKPPFVTAVVTSLVTTLRLLAASGCPPPFHLIAIMFSRSFARAARSARFATRSYSSAPSAAPKRSDLPWAVSRRDSFRNDATSTD